MMSAGNLLVTPASRRRARMFLARSKSWITGQYLAETLFWLAAVFALTSRYARAFAAGTEQSSPILILFWIASGTCALVLLAIEIRRGRMICGKDIEWLPEHYREFWREAGYFVALIAWFLFLLTTWIVLGGNLFPRSPTTSYWLVILYSSACWVLIGLGPVIPLCRAKAESDFSEALKPWGARNRVIFELAMDINFLGVVLVFSIFLFTPFIRLHLADLGQAGSLMNVLVPLFVSLSGLITGICDD